MHACHVVCVRACRCTGPSDRVDQSPGEPQGGCEACKFYLVEHRESAPYTLAPVKCLPPALGAQTGGFRAYFVQHELQRGLQASASGAPEGARDASASESFAEITSGIHAGSADGETFTSASAPTHLQPQLCPYGFKYNPSWTSHSLTAVWVCFTLSLSLSFSLHSSSHVVLYSSRIESVLLETLS